MDGILGRMLERNDDTEEIKFLPISSAELITNIEETKLSEIMYKAYVKITKKTFNALNASTIAGTLDWSEKLPAVSGVLTQAPSRAKLIHSTSNKTIKRVIGTAQQRGYSLGQLVRGVPKDGFRGMKSELGNTRVRATLIARTETTRTQNVTTTKFYKQQGYEYVLAVDPDGDANDTYVDPGDPYGRTCIERNGQVYRLEDAQDIEDHPNGTLAWMPMPRDYQPEGGI